ncbi:LysR family transcriptional regulator [Parasalinivibrio latis]|uniref:LysR family transcriptional regulator n=1 Tax=Parasalinivibrio latis TaxID=2952610 RepID=UPI0030E5935F
MDIHLLKTFVAVVREGTITRASEKLFLSQPAVSAHIKAMEESLGVCLFERTPRGMFLTLEGERLLVKAEQTLAAHRDLLDEATRLRGKLSGHLKLGVSSSTSPEFAGNFLMRVSEHYPDIQFSVEHTSTTAEILQRVKNDDLDMGLYNECCEPEPDFSYRELGRFDVYLAVSSDSSVHSEPVDWRELSRLTWIHPPSHTCCGMTAEKLFEKHGFRPDSVISIDRESVTRTLVAGGVGVGLLHADTAKEAESKGEVRLIYKTPDPLKVLLLFRADREKTALISSICRILEPEDSTVPTSLAHCKPL